MTGPAVALAKMVEPGCRAGPQDLSQGSLYFQSRPYLAIICISHIQTEKLMILIIIVIVKKIFLRESITAGRPRAWPRMQPSRGPGPHSGVLRSSEDGREALRGCMPLLIS
jgi:hypothetical protein